LEIRNGIFIGVEAPTYEEAKIVDAAVISDDIVEFMDHRVRPLLETGVASPYLCAWAVNECPQLGEIAYACLRKFAEKCRDINAKNA
jgi:hypothetical protein